MSSERVRRVVERIMAAVSELEGADEINEAITEIERRMIALAEGRVSSPAIDTDPERCTATLGRSADRCMRTHAHPGPHQLADLTCWYPEGQGPR